MSLLIIFIFQKFIRYSQGFISQMNFTMFGKANTVSFFDKQGQNIYEILGKREKSHPTAHFPIITLF